MEEGGGGGTGLYGLEARVKNNLREGLGLVSFLFPKVVP